MGGVTLGDTPLGPDGMLPRFMVGEVREKR